LIRSSDRMGQSVLWRSPLSHVPYVWTVYISEIRECAISDPHTG
jgi:hypothetical protein